MRSRSQDWSHVACAYGLGFALLFGVVLVAGGCGAPPLPATGALSQESFHSTIAGDDYLLRVRLPPGYDVDPARRYPLVVQLDPTYVGLQEYDITVGLVSQRAAAQRWSEAIVVGVDYPGESRRERDYRLPKQLTPDFSGEGADRFYRVLQREILPHLDGKLRIDPTRRTLVGHSNGAVFAWYTVFRHAPPEAPLFSSVVAADCGYDEELFTLQRWHQERSSSLPIRMYASRAVFNGASQQIVFRAMIARVVAAGYTGLQLVTEELETDHGGAIRPSFERGLELSLGGGA